MNTFVKFRDATSASTLVIENSHLHTIGQFMVWVQNAQTQKVILRSNLVDADNGRYEDAKLLENSNTYGYDYCVFESK